MSYREIRNFGEILRNLGYPRTVSMESFRSPNFGLAADILDWLVRRYDPSAILPDDIDTESQRIAFITKACEIIVSKTRLRLNPKKLYQSDGHAVKELLKFASFLDQSLKTAVSSSAAQAAEAQSDFQISNKLHDLKAARQAASTLLESGATLHDLLGKEKENSEARERAIAFLDSVSRNLDRNTEAEYIERSIHQLMKQDAEKLSDLKASMADLTADEKKLRASIQKRSQEIERAEKRLKSLKSVRPAFLDEFERLEEEVQWYFELYLEKFRNLDYLEHELGVLSQREQERIEANERQLKKMQKKLREDEWRILRGETDADLDNALDGLNSGGGKGDMRGGRPGELRAGGHGGGAGGDPLSDDGEGRSMGGRGDANGAESDFPSGSERGERPPGGHPKISMEAAASPRSSDGIPDDDDDDDDDGSSQGDELSLRGHNRGGGNAGGRKGNNRRGNGELWGKADEWGGNGFDAGF
uniref:Clusterin-associated protein 1 n=1 Tax=Chromera velia CCMP2878 TaxID=1169474 RepID=A0A0G4H231_9ALVE|eukprot:Cvel_5545.t1-p1 / transcript=Cvel_5545.t1 / gene=Cvel_5545 / organism=Chromera_velia_CCMP2878 / gene_product=Clusterin-associated protein 1, putative / transcript_product=Clusterin-associated protein 1, putative / location=Cvel_scaffold260:24858-28893(-) / protein_length=473 / sequence_SO=supercontig / SO=protein_coding / is_pseudo=false